MRVKSISTIFAICGIAAIGRADVAYSNLGAGDSFRDNGWAVGPFVDGNTYTEGMAFMSATTGKVSSIDFGGYVGGTFTMQLMSDVGGLPGSVMETWTGLNGAAPHITTATGDGSASLVTGTHYYVTLSSTVTTAWNWANTDTNDDLMAFSVNGGSTWTNFTTSSGEYRGAFRVNTSTVPEPASFAILGVGAIALTARRRRK